MSLILVALIAAAAPAAAQPAAPAPSPTHRVESVSTPNVDPARLALARTAIDRVWPLGTYQRLMSNMMMDQMMGAIFDLKVGEVMPDGEMSEEEKQLADTTMAQAIAKKDPHFMERMRITNRVLLAEMGPIMTKVEPAVRDALAVAYAKRFDAQQLADINRFFSTPSGRAFAAESMVLFMDPELMKATMGMMPEMMKAMPSILEKVKAATAHLPEPSKEDDEPGEAQADTGA